MEISSYLSAIQSLNGQNPGEKYQGLHLIAAQIIENDNEIKDFLTSGVSERVQSALLPYLRILVGNKLKLVDAVVEALKSDDVTIIKQALSAKWFFNAKNDFISVEYFEQKLLPFISLRTRLELIKVLGHCLVGDGDKADKFFGRFADLYGTEQVLPLIAACNENYIFEAVLKRRIVLPSRILNILYRRYPQLVLRYLRLGDENNTANKADRKLHRINLTDYVGFLPTLVRHHTLEFVELYEAVVTQNSVSIRLGSTRAEFFLKNGTDLLIEKPKLLLDLLPLKLVSNKFSTQQFEAMFANLFPQSEVDFFYAGNRIIKILQYYPQEKKFHLLEEKYKLMYGKSILDNKNFYFDSWLFELVPVERKEEYLRKMLTPLIGKDEYTERLEYLPPSESMPLLKEHLGKNSSILKRLSLVSKMISSCKLYDSKDDLLEFLRYYNIRHKNERMEVVQTMLVKLVKEFDVKTLDKEHWQELREVIQRSYVKGYFNSPTTFCDKLFKGALQYFLKQCKAEEVENETKLFLDKLVEIILETYLERNISMEFMQNCPQELERDCLLKFLAIVSQRYPETHKIWESSNNKLKLVLYLVNSIHNFNVRNFYAESKKRRKSKSGAVTTDSDGNETKQIKLRLRDYPVLIKLSIDLLKEGQKCKRFDKQRKLHSELRKIMRQHDRELYQNFIDSDPELMYDVESSDAIFVLKYEQNKILEKWLLYLKVSREMLNCKNKAVKHFIAATKWHHELPIKFVNQSLLELKEEGSLLILGILLDGHAFGKVVEPYLPKDKKMDVEDEDAKKTYEFTSTIPKAMNFVNPPVSFDVISSFCQGDYVTLAMHTLSSVAQRVPVTTVVAFASKLVDKPISVRKLGIRLVFQVLSKVESREFLARIWKDNHNSSIREVVGKMIFDVFTQTPSPETWHLIKVCIGGLTSEDQVVFEILSHVEAVDKEYTSQYTQEYLNKIDSFNKEDLTAETKLELIDNFVKNIDENVIHLLPEELITDIVKREFRFSEKFQLEIYLLSDPNKFDERLKTFLAIVEKKFDNYSEPDPEYQRRYPVKNKVRNFFERIYDTVFYMEKNDMIIKLINSCLIILSAKLKPWQNPTIYILANIAKDYVNSTTPRDFGIQLALTISRFVKEFESPLILNEISNILHGKLKYHMYTDTPENDRILTVIESLTQSNHQLGALIGINLLNEYHIKDYDERYDMLVKCWAAIENNMVRALLHDFQSKIQ